MRKGLRLIFLYFLLLPAVHAAETVYVADHLRLGVRAAPSSAEKAFAIVTTGDRLSLLGEEGEFLHIRTEEGVEGWVSKGYVSSEVPAINRLAALQQRYEQLQQENEVLGEKLSAVEAKESASSDRMATLLNEKASLQQSLSHYREIMSDAEDDNSMLYLAIVLLLIFLAGIILGVQWYKGRVAERIGGLEL